MLCAHANSQATCHGDSGGPLLLPDTKGGSSIIDGNPEFDVIVGIVSYGPEDCGQTEDGKFKPGVFTRVSSFRQWIDETMASAGGGSTTSPDVPPTPSESLTKGKCEQDCEKLNEDLYNAAGHGKSSRVKELLSKGADVNSIRGEAKVTPLHYAAAEGYVDIVEMLIEAGADVDAQNSAGITALTFATNFNRLDVVKVLVKSGAAVDFKMINGSTPLMSAVQNGFIEVAAFLLESGGDVNEVTGIGETPLMFSSISDNPALVRLLLDNGAVVDQTDTQGETSLHEAALYGSLLTAQVLLEAGANINAMDNSGKKPVDVICGCDAYVESPELNQCVEGRCGDADKRRLKDILQVQRPEENNLLLLKHNSQ